MNNTPLQLSKPTWCFHVWDRFARTLMQRNNSGDFVWIFKDNEGVGDLESHSFVLWIDSDCHPAINHDCLWCHLSLAIFTYSVVLTFPYIPPPPPLPPILSHPYVSHSHPTSCVVYCWCLLQVMPVCSSGRGSVFGTWGIPQSLQTDWTE